MLRPEVHATLFTEFDRTMGDSRDEETSGHVRGFLVAFAAWIGRLPADAPAMPGVRP